MSNTIVLDMPRSNGFLTPGDREKLTGEQSLEDYSNVSEWKKRVRNSITGVYEDMALLEASPYWTSDDFAKVFRNANNNTAVLSPLSIEGRENGISGVRAQTKIYGDTINNFAENLEDLDIGSSWQDTEEVEREVQEMFVRNVTTVITDVLHLVGATDDDVIREFFEDVWPERERALEIVEDELANG
ncbi:hypothetical protein [Haloarcula sp. JP-L23]|uniref:hypothetical protein n=1 Tax=Haloarcula sp. JP-L23 TaxID=2716717 RepID=UPI00140EE8B2|nr:hypothetical protein G9465_08625 [Haloarcula sp. JP-L23]